MSYVIVETIEDDVKMVTVAPSNWLIKDKLYWPKATMEKITKLVKQKATPKEEQWNVHENVKVLCSNILTYEEARSKEKYYSVYSNTDSEVEEQKRKKLKRLHPTVTDSLDEHDFNKDYVKLSEHYENDLQKQASPSPTCSFIRRAPLFSANFQAEKPPTPGKRSSPLSTISSPVSIQDEPHLYPLLQRTKSFRALTETSFQKENMFINDEKSVPAQTIQKKKLNKDKKSKLTNERLENLNRSIIIIEKNTSEMKDCYENLLNKVNLIYDTMNSFINAYQCNKKKKIVPNTEFQMPAIPLESTSSINSFNDRLLRETEFLEQVAVRLQGVVVMDLQKSIKFLMRKLFSAHVLTYYTWTGKSGIQGDHSKLIFSDLQGIIRLMEFTINLSGEITYSHEKVSTCIKMFVKRAKQNYSRECNNNKASSSTSILHHTL